MRAKHQFQAHYSGLVEVMSKSAASHRMLVLVHATTGMLRRHQWNQRQEAEARTGTSGVVGTGGGVELKAVRAMLGHASTARTAEAYSSVLPQFAREPEERIGKGKVHLSCGGFSRSSNCSCSDGEGS